MKHIYAGLAPLFFLLVTCLAGCAGTQNIAQLTDKAAETGMVRRTVAAGGFSLITMSRLQDAGQSIHLYIEGDGKAWLSSTEPSSDPTPKFATGLRLALQDRHANVVYLARPCQYSLAQSPACSQTYWTDRRFAPEVIDAMNAAVDSLKAGAPAQPIELIGYSGGAAIAVLLAARRKDVVSLRTVAGNLDHVAVNRHHGVSAMPESLNAIDVAAQLQGLPQIHFYGAEDKVVPSFIAASFAGKAGRCAPSQAVAKAGHERGWVEAWPRLLADVPQCGIS